MRTGMRRIFGICAAGLMLVLFGSCPEPITEAVVYQVEDSIAPVIVVEFPLGNDVYYSTVTVSGVITDDSVTEGDTNGAVRVLEFGIANDVLRKGRVNIAADGTVIQDEEYGSGEITFNPDSGEFSFEFSTVEPNLLSGVLSINVTAVDGNDNSATSNITLLENGGPFITIAEPGNEVAALYKRSGDQSNVQVTGTVGNSRENSDSADEIVSLRWRDNLNGWSGSLDVSGTDSEDYDESLDTYISPNTGFQYPDDFVYDPAARSFLIEFSVPWSVNALIPLEVIAEDRNGHVTTETITLYLDEAGPDIYIGSPDTNPEVYTYYNPNAGLFSPQTVTGYVIGDLPVTMSYQVRALNFTPAAVSLDIPTIFTGSDYTFDLDDPTVSLEGLTGAVTVTVIAKNEEDLQTRPEFKLYEDSVKPVISNVSIASSPATGYAKLGDTVTLSFQVTEEASGLNGNPAATFGVGGTAADSVTYNSGSGTWQATRVLQDADGTDGVDANVSFTINATDQVNNAADEVTVISAGSNVMFYEDAPTLAGVNIISDNPTPNTWVKEGETVTLTIASNRDLAAKPTVTIADTAVPAGDITEIDKKNYTAEYTFPETSSYPDGTVEFTIDFTDAAGNPGVQVDETSGVVTGGLTFDKTNPVISGVAFNTTSGYLVVGSGVTLTITTTGTETGNLAAGTLSVNGESGTPWIGDFTPNPTTADFTYTVQEGDTDRHDENYKIPLSVSVFDPAGNESSLFTVGAVADDSIDDNNPVIDGNTPVISGVTFSPATGWIKEGESFNIIASATGSETDLAVSGTILVNTKNVTASFINNTDGTYTFTCPVASGDTDIQPDESIPVTIRLTDPAGNISDAFILDGNEGDNINPDLGDYPGIDGNDPNDPAVSVFDSVNIAAAGQAHITGTGEPSATLHYSIDDDDADGTDHITGSVPIDGSGNWAINSSVSSLGDGILTVSVVAEDAAGNLSTGTVEETALKDTVAPSFEAVNPVVFSQTSGWVGVGESFTMTVDTAQVGGVDDTGLTVTAATVNGEDVNTGTPDNGDGTYTFTYQVDEGDDDILSESSQVPITIQFEDAAGNRNTVYTTPPAAASCPTIDGHSPALEAVDPVVFSQTSGWVGVGESFTMTVDTAQVGGVDDTGLTVTAATVNGEDVNTGTPDNGDGTYTFTYQVDEGDDDILSESSQVPITIQFEDAAGNRNTVYTTPPATASCPTIDAHSPVLEAVDPVVFSQTSGWVGVGESFTMTVDTAQVGGVDDTGLTVTAATVNGEDVNTGTPDNGDGTYTFTYQVDEGDDDILSESSQVPITIQFEDAAGNRNTVYTTPPAATSCPTIDAHSPVIAASVTYSHNASTAYLKSADVFTATIDAGETGLTVSSATINGVDVSSSNTGDDNHYTDNGDDTYTFQYTVGASAAEDIYNTESFYISITVLDAASNDSTLNASPVAGTDVPAVYADAPYVTAIYLLDDATDDTIYIDFSEAMDATDVVEAADYSSDVSGTNFTVSYTGGNTYITLTANKSQAAATLVTITPGNGVETATYDATGTSYLDNFSVVPQPTTTVRSISTGVLSTLFTRIKDTFTPSGDSTATRTTRRAAPIATTTRTEVSSPADAPEKAAVKITPPAENPRQADRPEQKQPVPESPGNDNAAEAPQAADKHDAEDFLYQRREAPAAAGGGPAADVPAGQVFKAEAAAEVPEETSPLTLALIILAAAASVGLVFVLFIRMMRKYGE